MEALQPQAAEGLGRPMEEYRIKRGRPFMPIATIVIGVVCAAAGVASPYPMSLFFYFIALGALGYGLIAGVFVWMDSDYRVQVFADGFTHTRREVSTTVRWDDIESVWQRITVHRFYRMYGLLHYDRVTHYYELETQNGSKMNFDDLLEAVEGFGTTLQKEVTRRKLPQAVETIKNGGSASFGKLSISAYGMSNGKESIPWEQVEGVNIHEGKIHVRKQGKWFDWAGQSVPEMPNVFVFLTLAEQIVGVNRQRK